MHVIFFHKAQLRCGGSEVVQLTAEALVPGSNLTVTITGDWVHYCNTFVKSQHPLSRGGPTQN